MKPKHDSAARRRAAEAQLKAQPGPCPPLSAADARRLLHELEVQKIELEMQNAELLAASVELEAALDRYTDLFDVAPVGFLDLTSDGTISLANSAGADLLGEPRGRLIGQRFQRFLREQNQSAFRYFLQQTLTFGPPHGCEVTLVRKDGSQRILQITGTRTRTGLNCRLVMLEVTKHRQAQSDLVETQENLFTLIDAMPDNVIFKDGEGRWLVVNSPAMKFFQLPDVRWQGRTDAELAVANPALKSLHEACIRSDEIGWAAGKLSRVTERGPGPDGKMQEHEVQKVPLFHPDGRRQALLVVGRDVTEKRRLEQSLKMSELMASQSRDVQLLVRRTDGKICNANPAAEEYYGYTRAELLSRNIADLRETNDAAQTAQQMAEAFAQGIQFETVHVRKDGGVMPVEVSSQGIHFEGEDYLVSVIRDISVRKQTEAKLHQLEQSMAVAANGIFLVDTAGKIFWVNAAFTRLTGYRAEEALGQTPRMLKSGQHDVGFYRQMWQTVLAKKVWQGELINRRKDGTLYNENTTITPVTDAAGRVTHFICVQEDITERKQAERQLQESEERYRDLVENARDLIFILAPDGTFTSVNRVVELISGRLRAEWIGKAFAPLVHPDDLPLAGDTVRRAFNGEPVEPFELRGHPRFPQRVCLEITLFARKDALGNIIGVMGIGRDVTARRQAEQLLVASEHKYRRLYESITDGIVSVALSGQIQEFNPAYAQMLGYPGEELLRRTYEDLTPEKWHAFEARIIQEQILPRGYSDVYEKEYRRQDGTVFPVELLTHVIKDGAGQVTGLWATVRDITARKQAENKIKAAAIFNQATIDALAAHLCVLDEHGTILATNRAWNVFTESSPTPAQNTLVGGNYLAVCDTTVVPETADARTFAAGIRAVIQGERDRFSLEYPCHSPKEQFWFVASVTRFNESIPARVVVTHENISERKRTEAEIIRARDFHLRLLEKAPALVWRAGLDAKWDWFNEAWLTFTGRTFAQERGEGWLAGVHPDDLDGCMKSYLASFHQREPFTLLYRLRRQDGEYRWISDQGNPYDSLDGEFAGYIGFCYDIHESILAKELLEERVQKRTQEIALLSEVIDQSEVAFAITHPDGRFIRINAAYTRLVGYSRTEVMEIKRAWASELTPPEWQTVSAAKVEKCLHTRMEVRFEKEYRRKDGTRVPVELFMQPIYDAAGNFVHLLAFITDISQRKRTERALVQSNVRNKFLSEVVENSELPFCIGTMSGQLTMVNEAFVRLTGYTRDELTHANFSWAIRLTPPEWHQAEATLLAECVRTRQPVRYEKEYLAKAGRRFPVELFVQPIFNELGQLLNFRVFLTDISVRKQQAAELKTALEKADQASRAKSDFLSHMSHEIRTPMNAILGFTQILQQDTTLPAGVQEKLQTIGRSGQNLLGILNDILDLAKVESGRANLSPTDFHLRDFVEEIVDLFRQPAENKLLTLRLVVPAEIPRHVWADADKIRRVLGNLLGNAVKFTQTGGIEVALAVDTGPDQKRRLRLAVRDTGPGIALPDIVHRLFKKFEQINPDQLRQAHAGGTGLGLSISQQYARLMGGDISVHSVVGQGSTFELDIPIELGSDTEFITRPIRNSLPQLAPGHAATRILVVDDLEDNRNYLQELLLPAGFEVRTAASGAESLAACAEWNPHLVLMDTRMPEMDGLETIRRLRAVPAYSALKIITVSASTYPEDQAATRLAGADEFVAKPVLPQELLEKIRHLLGLTFVRPPATVPPAAATARTARAELVALLAAQPESWRYHLRDHLLLADFIRVKAAINTLLPWHPAAAQSLLHLAAQFDSDALLQLLADAAPTQQTNHD